MEKTLKKSHIYNIRPGTTFIVLLITLLLSLVLGLSFLFLNAEASSMKMIKFNSAEIEEVIASAKGTKYYYPWCGGLNNIKQNNIIKFQTKEGAELAGYALAKNCKGPH
jgi:hypothetical protein